MTRSRKTSPRAYLALARPAQWNKNGFVLVGLLFGHAWTDPLLVRDAIACFIGFCLVASAVYAFNDVLDRVADRAHPGKRDRPVASRAVGVAGALMAAAIWALAGLCLAGLASMNAAALMILYIAMNLGYSLGLKHVVVLDVLIISAGFMLRILAGTLGVGIEPSRWLIFCGFMLTLFLGFAKRRAELAAFHSASRINGAQGDSNPLPDNPLGNLSRIAQPRNDSANVPARRVLAAYSLPWLDRIIVACAAGALVAYTAYTLDAGTVALHGTDRLLVTVPIVIYGMGRYLWTLYRHGLGADPATQMWSDPHLFGSVIGWLALTGWLIA
ncbi:MAG: decaprenyl-phosphate phosphoribosyltransferase [Betaproteobacteria bacterium]|nr:decaprenyl-phosphate phosphoribosyltransferase [Betaproteobacteria bacterium]